MAAGRRCHRPRLDPAARRHGESRPPSGHCRGQEGPLRPTQGWRRRRGADRSVVLGPRRADRSGPRCDLLRGQQGVRARRSQPAGMHCPAPRRHRRLRIDGDRQAGDHQRQVAGSPLPDRADRRRTRRGGRPPRAAGRRGNKHRRRGQGNHRHWQGVAHRSRRGARGRARLPRIRRRRRPDPRPARGRRGEESVSGLDELDQLAAEAFEGYLVRKDLAQQFRGQYPVPTYVGEFLLGRYCATTDPDEIAEGLAVVERSMKERTVRAGEEELFKSRAREKGKVKVIDLLRARLDAQADAYKVELPSLQLNGIHISDALVNEHDRMLTGGFYAEVTLEYIAALARQSGDVPFRIESVRPIQMSTRDALDTFVLGRVQFTLDQWRDLLLRSVGFEPERFTRREQDILLARMVPFVAPNYNAVELGPRGTGKSHLFQQVSPYAHLVSGGKTTVARLFVNNANGQRGLVCQYDVVCFDEVSGVSFDQKDGVNIMKGYMESGEFSRGRVSIRADGGIVLVGNFDVDVQHQQRIGHLLGPLPSEMRDDTAFMDRIHSYVPGWDIPKISRELLTDHFGLVSDFLSECWNQLRNDSRLTAIQGRVHYGGALSGRDTTAVNRTVNGLLKLLYPNREMPIAEEDLEWTVRLAMECRRRVKEQQKRIGSAEFRNTHFSYQMGNDGIEAF